MSKIVSILAMMAIVLAAAPSTYARALATAVVLPNIPSNIYTGQWIYHGCYQDYIVPKSAETVGEAWAADIKHDWSAIRALPFVKVRHNNGNLNDCADFGNVHGTNYMGMEVGQECWFGNNLDTGKFPRVADHFCQTHACAADKSSACGGQSFLQVYKNFRAP